MIQQFHSAYLDKNRMALELEYLGGLDSYIQKYFSVWSGAHMGSIEVQNLVQVYLKKNTSIVCLKLFKIYFIRHFVVYSITITHVLIWYNPTEPNLTRSYRRSDIRSHRWALFFARRGMGPLGAHHTVSGVNNGKYGLPARSRGARRRPTGTPPPSPHLRLQSAPAPELSYSLPLDRTKKPSQVWEYKPKNRSNFFGKRGGEYAEGKLSWFTGFSLNFVKIQKCGIEVCLGTVGIRKLPSAQRLSGAFPAEFPLPNKFEIHTERERGRGGRGRGERCG